MPGKTAENSSSNYEGVPACAKISALETDETTMTHTMSSLRRWSLRSTAIAGLALPLSGLAQSENTQQAHAALGAAAREAMISIFDRKDGAVIDEFFSDRFIQHDPNISDGLSGLRQYAAGIAASPKAKIKIYRTLEDGDLVLLHSKYEGLNGPVSSLIAFDLFRFKDGKIVEHWGGQEPEAPPNPSGHTQVDGRTDIADRDKTQTNRELVRAFKETITVQLRFDQIDRFIQDGNYTQHASKVGDGIGRMKSRVAEVAKPSRVPVLNPRRYVADGNFVLALVEANAEGGPTANYDLFRVDNGKIVEHWDVLSRIPPREQWKNLNGPY
jgi:predicted SnoaL-like aldol condensation-catalyzing enzyme